MSLVYLPLQLRGETVTVGERAPLVVMNEGSDDWLTDPSLAPDAVLLCRGKHKKDRTLNMKFNNVLIAFAVVPPLRFLTSGAVDDCTHLTHLSAPSDVKLLGRSFCSVNRSGPDAESDRLSKTDRIRAILKEINCPTFFIAA